MNQNRNNNRRRGRGNNRGGQGGGNQGNRIDSRARGNAPQMLEKYRKLAHDASLNGDRVQTEYYLQFADHYFRVIADMRAQKDEQRPRRDNDREHAYDPAFDGTDDFDDLDEGRGRQQQQHGRRDDADEAPADEGRRGIEGDEVETIDADDNPFTRDTRGRGPRSRGRNRPANDADLGAEAEAAGDDAGFDPGILPPSIARDEEAPRRPARGRRRPRPEEDGEEPLEAVS